MTDKERLEEIKRKFDLDRIRKFLDTNLISPQDLIYLIQQAERVKELETTVDFYQSALRDADRRVQELENHIDHLYDNNVHLKGDCRLQEQNKRYREALEFYANKINYLTFIENGKSNIEHDKGEKARKALELSDEEVSKRYFWF